jgi:predicted nucleotidyltransferase
MIRRKQHIIQLIRQKVNEIDNTAEVILYGSRARGDNKHDSDWDVMILLKRKNVDKKVEQTFRHHLLDLELEIGVPISVFVYSKSDWEGKYSVTPLFRNIKKEGILIP